MGDRSLPQILAPLQGFFRAEVELLEEVKKGQRLGTIRDAFGAVISEACANRDGVVIMLRRPHSVREGDGLAHVTGKQEG